MTQIGIDIGGSGVRGGVVCDGQVQEIVAYPLNNRETETVVSTVVRLVQTLDSAGPVGVSVPGFIQNDIIRASPNFPSWKDLPLATLLSEQLNCPVTLMNDANAAALGAWTERGEQEDLVMLTLGTGVGGGVIIDGLPLVGARGTGAELGHIFAGGDRLCGCGARGCLETWISTTGLLAAARERDQECTDGKEVVLRADQGEEWAIEICHAAAEALGRGLASLINLFNPDTLLLCGGLANAHTRFGPPAMRVLAQQAIAPNLEHLNIVWGPRAEHFAILGASRQAMRMEL